MFFELSEKILRDSKNEFELAMVNEPSVFELLRFDCSRHSCWRDFTLDRINYTNNYWFKLISFPVNTMIIQICMHTKSIIIDFIRDQIFYTNAVNISIFVLYPLRKHANSNILKILSQKKKKKKEFFSIKILIFFTFLLKNIDCGYSLELYKSWV